MEKGVKESGMENKEASPRGTLQEKEEVIFFLVPSCNGSTWMQNLLPVLFRATLTSPADRPVSSEVPVHGSLFTRGAPLEITAIYWLTRVLQLREEATSNTACASCACGELSTWSQPAHGGHWEWESREMSSLPPF